MSRSANNPLPRFTAPVTEFRHLPHLDPETPILDIGSGYGRALEVLRRQGFSRLFGCEPDTRFFTEGSPFPVTIARGEAAPFRSRSFGAVLMVGVLSYILEDERREALIREIERVLLPQGLFCGSCFLISPDPYHQQKYRQGRNRFDTNGTFESDSGGIYRHSHETDLRKQFDNFHILSWTKKTFITQNRREALGLIFEGRKKD